jgi:hypothetical protein
MTKENSKTNSQPVKQDGERPVEYVQPKEQSFKPDTSKPSKAPGR